MMTTLSTHSTDIYEFLHMPDIMLLFFSFFFLFVCFFFFFIFFFFFLLFSFSAMASECRICLEIDKITN